MSTTTDAAAASSIAGNLATEANGAFVLASSFANYESLYTDNLIDGDEQTRWQPLDPVLPQWLEVRWDVPVWVDRVCWADWRRAPARVQYLGLGENAGAKWQRSHDTPPADRDDRPVRAGADAACACSCRTATLTASSYRRCRHHPGAAAVPAPEAYWHASYIWYPSRMRFTGERPGISARPSLSTAEDVRSAVLQLRSNDYYQAFINGVPVATGSTRITPTRGSTW